MEDFWLKLILLAIGQTVAVVWAGVKLYFSNARLNERVAELEKNRELMLHEIKELNHNVVKLTSHVELLLLGKIKTANAQK